jgi:cytoskeletal protein RodZ
MTQIVPDSRARQGSRGKPVFLVLIGSVVLIGLFMVSMLVWSGSQSPPSPSQDAARQNASPSASSSNTARTPSANPAYPVPASPSATGSTGAPNR